MYLISEGEDTCLVNTELLAISNGKLGFSAAVCSQFQKIENVPFKTLLYLFYLALSCSFPNETGIYISYSIVACSNILVKEHETRQWFWNV